MLSNWSRAIFLTDCQLDYRSSPNASTYITRLRLLSAKLGLIATWRASKSKGSSITLLNLKFSRDTFSRLQIITCVNCRFSSIRPTRLWEREPCQVELLLYSTISTREHIDEVRGESWFSRFNPRLEAKNVEAFDVLFMIFEIWDSRVGFFSSLLVLLLLLLLL